MYDAQSDSLSQGPRDSFTYRNESWEREKSKFTVVLIWYQKEKKLFIMDLKN